jgi:hypothetical protein
MGPHWALFAHLAVPTRRSRTPLAGESRRAQWRPLGPEDRGSLGRLARPLPVVSDLPPAISAVGPGRPAAEHPRNARASAARRRLSGSAGSIHRRKLRARQAGWCRSRQDQARQGVEDHGIADRQGLPVAVHAERTGRKTVGRSDATNGGGRSSDSLPGSRRLVVRYERLAENFLGMLHLACCIILLRGL